MVNVAFVCLLFTAILKLVQCTVIGLVTRDAVLLSSTTIFSPQGHVAMSSDYEWIHDLTESANILVGLEGDSSDCNALLSKLRAMANEHELTFGRPMSTQAVASLCRKIIYQSLRTPSHLKVNVLIAGLLGSDDHSFNNENELSITTSASPYSRPLVLYYVDMVGALQQIPYAAHGNESPFVLSLFDRKRRNLKQGQSAMSAQEGVECLKECWEAVRKRTMGRENVGKCIVRGILKTGENVHFGYI